PVSILYMRFLFHLLHTQRPLYFTLFPYTTLFRSEIKQELSENTHLIEDLTNFTPKLFRPPYGYYNNTLIEVCDELGLSCIEWSVDRKSTRLNSSHVSISYAVLCLKKKITKQIRLS